MNEILENIELIEAYYEDRLEGSELERVQLLLQTDPVFFEEYNLYLKIVQGIKSTHEEEILHQLKIIDFKKDNPSKVYTNGSGIVGCFLGPRGICRTAAIITLFLLSSAYVIYDSYFSDKAFLKKYYVEEMGLPVLMGEERDLKLDEAMNFYKTADYKSSYHLINDMLAREPENDTFQYFSGVLLMKLNDPQKASEFFMTGAIKENSVYHLDCEYRLAVSLFLSGNQDGAKKIFEKIAGNTQHPYSQSSKNLLEKLF